LRIAGLLQPLLPGWSWEQDVAPIRLFNDSYASVIVSMITTSDQITIRLERRAYSPVLRKASLPPAATISWCAVQQLTGTS
jgi:hypothetical protein